MKKNALFLPAIFFSCCILFCGGDLSAQPAAPEQTNSAENTDAQSLLRANLIVQEQLHTALRAIEEALQDADAAAKKNAELFTERLNAVEKSLAVQREQDLESLRNSNRFILVAASVLAVIGVLALLGTAYFQIRAMNRIADMGAMFSSAIPLDATRTLGVGNLSVPARLNSAEQANARLLATIEQLEKRIHELDSSTIASRPAIQHGHDNGSETESDAESAAGHSPKVASLLSEGESFLSAGDAEKALACFDEALQIEPHNTDALVKKGTALEALRKMQEAIETYDRAIAADSSMTVAYLYKGGVLNRLQRFNEAMECYQQALRTHPKNAG
jgi:tetratricopeptide (TPR) repeat protein